MASKNVSRAKVAKYAAITGFQCTANLGRYLGFPLLTGRIKKSDFGFIIDKINGRLAGWKSKLLNRAGRVTLAKSVISSMPIYTMQNNWIPEGICDKLDATVRNFVWGGFHSHWNKWETITKPMRCGGLGIHTARNTNISLLGKHVWDLLHNQDKLRVQCLSAKYLKDSNILHATPSVGASYTWNSIWKAMDAIKSGFQYRVGRGEISIWYDKWLNEYYLCHLVPYVEIQNTQLQLKDIYSNYTWHWERLGTPIPSSVKLQVQSLFIEGQTDDLLTWGILLQELTLLGMAISGSLICIVLITALLILGLGSRELKFQRT